MNEEATGGRMHLHNIPAKVIWEIPLESALSIPSLVFWEIMSRREGERSIHTCEHVTRCFLTSTIQLRTHRSIIRGKRKRADKLFAVRLTK